jgi:hypothetical protein
MIQSSNYLLFDAARADKALFEAQEKNPDNRSLYLGTAQEELFGVAPYLFNLKNQHDFKQWFMEHGWNNHWGLMLQSEAPFDEIFKHCRKFLLVKKEDGEQLYFRFYDPRVLRVFLPTCDRQQLNEFFGPVKCFITEDENPENVLIFRLRNGELMTEKMSIQLAFVDNKLEELNKSESKTSTIEQNPPGQSNSWID